MIESAGHHYAKTCLKRFLSVLALASTRLKPNLCSWMRPSPSPRPLPKGEGNHLAAKGEVTPSAWVWLKRGVKENPAGARVLMRGDLRG